MLDYSVHGIKASFYKNLLKHRVTHSTVAHMHTWNFLMKLEGKAEEVKHAQMLNISNKLSLLKMKAHRIAYDRTWHVVFCGIRFCAAVQYTVQKVYSLKNVAISMK